MSELIERLRKPLWKPILNQAYILPTLGMIESSNAGIEAERNEAADEIERLNERCHDLECRAMSIRAATVEECAPKRDWIIDLIRNEYDPKPSYMTLGDGWDDGAERIADAIIKPIRALKEQPK